MFSLWNFFCFLEKCINSQKQSCAIGRIKRWDIDKFYLLDNNVITLIKHFIKDKTKEEQI